MRLHRSSQRPCYVFNLKSPVHTHYIPQSKVLSIAVGSPVEENGEVYAEGEWFGFLKYTETLYRESCPQSGIHAHITPHFCWRDAIDIAGGEGAKLHGSGISKAVKIHVQPVAGEARAEWDIVLKACFTVH